MRPPWLRFLDLRPGESRTFAVSFALLALTIGGHTLVETARDTLFLSRQPPEGLALVYVAIALSAFVLTPLSSRLVRTVGPRNALVATLMVTAYGIAWFRLQVASATMVFALYVFGALAATTLVAQFWMLAASLFTPAQGRRLFGPIAAGGVLGAVIGAGLASLMLLWVRVPALLVVAAAAFFAAALVATTLDLDHEPSPDAESPPSLAPVMPAELAKQKAFVSRLAIIAATSIALSVVVDYIFKVRVVRSVPAESLASFFAGYQLVLNAVSLAIQLLVTGPLIARLGVLGVALLTPTLLLIGSGIAVASGAAFFSTAVLKTLDAALRNSVQRVGLELLWAPVENVRKHAAKAFVDGVVTRGAQAAAALLLLLLTQRAGAGPRMLSLLAMAIAVPWVVAVARVRIPYIDLFRGALQRGNIDRELSLPSEIDLTAAEALLEALARPEPNYVIAALDVLAERNRGRLIPALILYHDDERVLERALTVFSAGDRRDWLPLAERLLTHGSEGTRLAAVRALALASHREGLERATHNESPAVQATATLHLALLDGHAVKEDPRVLAVLAAPGESGRQLRLALIEAIAAHRSVGSTPILLDLARDPALTGEVTRALVTAGDTDAIPFLIERLCNRDGRAAARKALVRLGQPAFDAVLAKLDDPSTPRALLLHLPRTLSQFASPAAIQALLALLRSPVQGSVRYKALRGLEHIALNTAHPIPIADILSELAKNAAEYLRLFVVSSPLRRDPAIRSRTSRSLVLGLVEDKLQQSQARIAHLVQIAQRTDDVPSVFSALRSSDRYQRARAIEFLDALVRTWERNTVDTPQLLRLVIDEFPEEERIRRAEPWTGPPPADTEQALERFSRDPDPLLSEIAREAARGPAKSRPRSYPPPQPSPDRAPR